MNVMNAAPSVLQTCFQKKESSEYSPQSRHQLIWQHREALIHEKDIYSSKRCHAIHNVSSLVVCSKINVVCSRTEGMRLMQWQRPKIALPPACKQETCYCTDLRFIFLGSSFHELQHLVCKDIPLHQSLEIQVHVSFHIFNNKNNLN